MKLIVGLGNPGKKYEKTRHNIGFSIVEDLGKELGVKDYKDKFQGHVAEINYNGEKVLILKPQTYMNLSGESVISIMNFYKLTFEDIIVVYDDMDLPLGKLRIKDKGSSGGHNGIKSIISYIGENFLRLKCGIGKPIQKDANINFVTSSFTKEEQSLVNEMSNLSVLCLIDLLKEISLEKIMQKYNKK
ncbi:MAG: aminoacyl-tRNA hydrolase [Fusobacteriaceae bacterium]